MNKITTQLLQEIQQCRICAASLPFEPLPILQMHPQAKILIVGQAPGKKAHRANKPFNDPSGKRLRHWLGIDEETFYNDKQIAILPMGFCYPGSGRSGDLAPRKECAPAWRARALASLTNIELTLVIGKYAHDYHLNSKASLTENITNWQQYWPHYLPMPHPSPRNNIWLKKHPWFEATVIPILKSRIIDILNNQSSSKL